MTRVTILDGGMGKELRRIGAPFRQPEWSALALLEAPGTVIDAHRNFVDAGAEVIITNSYGVVPFHLGQERFDERGHELAELAARIARNVADDAPHPVTVAGSLPPLFGSYRPEAFIASAAPGLWGTLVEAQAPFVDLWVAETISSLQEFHAVRAAATDDDRPFWAAFALADALADGRPVLRSGETVDAIATIAGECSAVLFNCSQPEVISEALPELRRALDAAGTSTPIGAYANAFQADVLDAGTYSANEVILERRPDLTPERYVDIVEGWVDAGATILGGCCDMYPEHIAALHRRFAG